MPCSLCTQVGHNRRTCSATPPVPHDSTPPVPHDSTHPVPHDFIAPDTTVVQLNHPDKTIVGSIHDSVPTWVHVYHNTDYQLKDWFIHIIQYHFNWTKPDIIMYNIITPQCEAHLKRIIDSFFYMYDKRLVIICKDEELPEGVEKGIINAIECLYYHSIDEDFPDITDTLRLRNGVFFKILTELELYLTPILRIACNGEPLGFRSQRVDYIPEINSPNDAQEYLIHHNYHTETTANTLAPICDSPCTSNECIICFDELLSTDVFTTRCGHMFHGTCMIKHIKHHDNCPMCRGVLHI